MPLAHSVRKMQLLWQITVEGYVVWQLRVRMSLLAECPVGLGRKEIGEYLKLFEGKLVVGYIDSPNNVTVSGDVDAIQGLQKRLDAEDGERPIFNRRLKVPRITPTT